MVRDDGRPGHGRDGKFGGRGGAKRQKPFGTPAQAGEAWRRGRPAAPEALDVAILYGWHPVYEALANGRRHPRRLFATENALRRLTDALGTLPIEAEIVRPDEIGRRLGPDAVHQGLLLEADPLPSPTLETLPPDALVLVLDQITDPHNVGAITRTAAAFGVDAIVTTARHSPAATGVMAKSASGGLEHVPFVIVRNLAEALLALGERGFQKIGLDSEGPAPLDAIPLRRPLALVLGAEGKGLRQLTRERCDNLARLDMPGAIKSLNVSNAAAVSLYAVTMRLGARPPA
ncbi:RNA methyltransferase [Chelatococcus sp. SYSU_G07232]|uniref:RNA methyltransferase n=1 Tax=Chelatococcus albus TaxID=3047466 RepID=A0ABT7AE03_9HYPH|nr:RNA methyltransferase [Chelatococcus sp. SYSU_G07232]MDJ1157315.1 RNA methyltransferase [Chelatococcus sp. SYSU_G07232]